VGYPGVNSQTWLAGRSPENGGFDMSFAGKVIELAMVERLQPAMVFLTHAMVYMYASMSA
jgi:hypothetical protein